MIISMNPWLAITIAIVFEVMATTALKASNEFTNLIPSILVIVGYGTAFYFMTVSMRVLPMGIMYAVWSGVGIILISLLGWWFYKQTLDMAAMIGIALIIAGVIVINAFSNSVHG